MKPQFSQQQCVDICTAVITALQSCAMAKGASISAEDLDRYTDIVARVVPQALIAAGADLPWARSILRKTN